MDRLGPRVASGVEHAFLRQIALGGRPRAQQIGLVGELDVQRAAVGLGVHGDGRDPELPKRAEDVDRDLAAVCDEHLEKTATAGLFSLANGARGSAHGRPRGSGADHRRPLRGRLLWPRLWATALFAVAMATDWFDGRIGRRSGRASAWSLLDPVADSVLVLTVLIVLVDRGVFPGWMVAAIVARSSSRLRLAALERGVVLSRP